MPGDTRCPCAEGSGLGLCSRRGDSAPLGWRRAASTETPKQTVAITWGGTLPSRHSRGSGAPPRAWRAPAQGSGVGARGGHLAMPAGTPGASRTGSVPAAPPGRGDPREGHGPTRPSESHLGTATSRAATWPPPDSPRDGGRPAPDAAVVGAAPEPLASASAGRYGRREESARPRVPLRVPAPRACSPLRPARLGSAPLHVEAGRQLLARGPAPCTAPGIRSRSTC